jgi:hypothetical protein
MCYLVTIGTRETRAAVEHLCSGRFDSEEIRVGGRFTLSASLMENCVLLRRRTFFLWTAAVLLAASCVPTPAHAQAQPVDDLLKAMLFWFDMPGPKQTTELTADVRKSLDIYRVRIEAFK